MKSSYMNTSDNVMILTGQGQVSTPPDLAIIRLGVETTGENLTRIQSDNAKISQQVLDSLNSFDISKIQTAQYTIQRLFDYVDNQRVDRGYTVRNIFQIQMRNMEEVGPLIDAAVASGANVIDFIEFDVAAPDDYYRMALDLAIKNAQQKALSIGTTLDVVVDSVPRKITETSQPITFARSIAREAAFATPIEPGTKQIEASVSIEFEYYKE